MYIYAYIYVHVYIDIFIYIYVHGAIAILEDAEKKLYEKWDHQIKDSSRSVLPCKGCPEEPPNPGKWPVVESFPCLGHTLSNDACMRQCSTHTKSSMCKAFWGNCGHLSLKGAPLQANICFLNSACLPLLSCWCPRWPPQRKIASELDRLQSKMMAILCAGGRARPLRSIASDVISLPPESARELACGAGIGLSALRAGMPTLMEGTIHTVGLCCSSAFMERTGYFTSAESATSAAQAQEWRLAGHECGGTRGSHTPTRSSSRTTTSAFPVYSYVFLPCG